MSWKKARYELVGDCPIILKSSKMANPLNTFAKELKAVSSKRVKTDADHAEMGRIEFYGGIYMHEDLGPVLMGNNLVAAVVEGAKKTKEGKIATSAVFAADPGYFAIQYEGPRTVEEMFRDTTPRPTPECEGFRFVTSVVRNGSRVISTRPIIHDWSAVIELMYESSIINFNQLDAWLKKAGALVGLCEWRPRYGRFTANCLSKDGEADGALEQATATTKKSREKSFVRS